MQDSEYSQQLPGTQKANTWPLVNIHVFPQAWGWAEAAGISRRPHVLQSTQHTQLLDAWLISPFRECDFESLDRVMLR